MKIAGRKFVLSERRPKVLLLGNGINRAFEGVSWNELLDELKDKTKYPEPSDSFDMPMPLKAVMLSEQPIGKIIRSFFQEGEKSASRQKMFTETNPELRSILKQFFSKEYDYILTTNYSYENECAILEQETISFENIAKYQHFTVGKRPQTHFLLNTFNIVDSRTIWHIHGEARKPDTMIVGQDYYGKLLSKCCQEAENLADTASRKVDTNDPIQINSWVDAVMVN